METDEFRIQTPDETRECFSDETLTLAEGVTAYATVCNRCGRRVVAINHLPTMFSVNVCYEDGTIFGTVRICPDCVWRVFQPHRLESEEVEN